MTQSPPSPQSRLEAANVSGSDWFKTAVFYEVLVRSFKDSNGDGVGGLPVADPDLVLLRVEVLLAARPDGDVLEQLVAGVHPPAR